MTRLKTPAALGDIGEKQFDTTAKPIWQEFEEVVSTLPAQVINVLPTDGADQHDHYIYGAPKRSE